MIKILTKNSFFLDNRAMSYCNYEVINQFNSYCVGLFPTVVS
jgi:hypothetical protein